MKLETTVTEVFKKGEIYNLADGDLLLPKSEYSKYFENSDESSLTEGGEWMAEDRCIKSFKTILKIYT